MQLFLEKEKYRNFVELHKESIPIYYFEEYLDIVTHNKWEAIVIEENGKCIGIFPLDTISKYKTKALINPILTQYLGLWLDTAYSKRYKDVVSLLCDYLKKNYTYINFTLHHHIQSHLEWEWQGFHQEPRFTFLIKYNDLHFVQSKYHKATKSDIRHASDNLLLTKEKSSPNFELLTKGLVISGLKPSKAEEIIDKLLSCSFTNLYSAINKKGILEATVLTVEDQNTTFNLINGREINATRGATSMLINQAITDAIGKGKNFDFEGSSLPGVYQFFESFGGELTYYHKLYKTKYHWADALLKTLGKI